MRLIARFVIRADDQQPRILALRAGVGLKPDRLESGDLGEPFLKLLEENLIPLSLLGRLERMNVRKLRPGDRKHLAGRVELHRARAERDHALREREIARLKTRDVA